MSHEKMDSEIVSAFKENYKTEDDESIYLCIVTKDGKIHYKLNFDNPKEKVLIDSGEI